MYKKIISVLLSAILFFQVAEGTFYSYTVGAQDINISSQEKFEEYIIKYKNNSDTTDRPRNRSRNIQPFEVKEQLDHGTYEVISFYDSADTEQEINNIKQSPEVEYICPNYELNTFSDTEQTDMGTNQGDIETLLANNLTISDNWGFATGEGVFIGVLDTGIDISHPDISQNIWKNANEIPDNGIDDDNNGFVDDYYGWDFANDDNSVFDNEVFDRHGTAVAGIIASKENKNVLGVAPNATIVPLKFMNDTKGKTSDAIRAIAYAK